MAKIQEKLQHLPNIKNQSTTTYIAIYGFPISFFKYINKKFFKFQPIFEKE